MGMFQCFILVQFWGCSTARCSTVWDAWWTKKNLHPYTCDFRVTRVLLLAMDKWNTMSQLKTPVASMKTLFLSLFSITDPVIKTFPDKWFTKFLSSYISLMHCQFQKLETLWLLKYSCKYDLRMSPDDYSGGQLNCSPHKTPNMPLKIQHNFI